MIFIDAQRKKKLTTIALFRPVFDRSKTGRREGLGTRLANYTMKVQDLSLYIHGIVYISKHPKRVWISDFYCTSIQLLGHGHLSIIFGNVSRLTLDLPEEVKVHWLAVGNFPPHDV